MPSFRAVAISIMPRNRCNTEKGMTGPTRRPEPVAAGAEVPGEGREAVIAELGFPEASMESGDLPLLGSVWYLLSGPTGRRGGWPTSPMKVVSSGSLTYDRSSTCEQSPRLSHCPAYHPPPSPHPQRVAPGPVCSPSSPRSRTAPAPDLASSHLTAA